MAPTAVRMVLVEGENGDGVTVDEDNFALAADPHEITQASAAEQVISAILGTREGAAEGGYQLTSTGVSWTDPVDATALRDALATRKVENVMLVSAFLAAAALTHAVGNATNYAQTALLFIEPDSATLAVVDSADGSIADIHRQPLSDDDDAAVAQLADLLSGAEELETHPDAVFVVGSGVDIPLIKPTLEAATTLPVTVPEEPETALARGAALASANTPLLVSSTAARAYAQDLGTGAPMQYTLDAAHFGGVSDDLTTGDGALAYSAVSDDADHDQRKPFALIGSVLASIFIVGVASLVVALAINIRTTSGARPDAGQPIVVPTQPAPAAPAPVPQQAPAPVPEAPAPVPQAPVNVPQAPVNVPQAPVPVPDAPAPIPVPVPAAPAPAPAPIPIPVPIPLPIFTPQFPLNPPGNSGRSPGGGKPPSIGKFPGGGGGGGRGGHGGGGHGGGGGKGGGGGRGGGINIPLIPGI